MYINNDHTPFVFGDFELNFVVISDKFVSDQNTSDLIYVTSFQGH